MLCGWRTSGDAHGISEAPPWGPREEAGDPKGRPRGRVGCSVRSAWNRMGRPWVHLVSTGGQPWVWRATLERLRLGVMGAGRDGDLAARDLPEGPQPRNRKGIESVGISAGGRSQPAAAPCALATSRSLVRSPWMLRGNWRIQEGTRGSTLRAPCDPSGPPREHHGSIELRGRPWNRRGALGGNRRIPGSGRGTTLDPRGGTWIRSLGPVGTAWEHLRCERGTGGSQWGAREHMRSTVGALWRHWRGARGCAL